MTRYRARIAWNAAWAVALTWALIADYTDASLPGHDTLVLGAHFYPHHLSGLAWLVTGGLAFWAGLCMMTGKS
jgi:hypothetical protein